MKQRSKTNMGQKKRNKEVSPHSEPKIAVQDACARLTSSTMVAYVGNDDRINSVTPRQANAGSDFELVTMEPEPTVEEEEVPAVQVYQKEGSLAPPQHPLREPSPFPSHPLFTDADSLQAAVAKNPRRICEAIRKLLNERACLRVDLSRTSAELISVTEDLENTRIDHKAARSRYEDLFRVASAKQAILWKYIESLHNQLASTKGQPGSDLGARNEQGTAMETGGGPAMGVPMEQWITDGMDDSIGPRHSEEDSEQGTDRSVWSVDDIYGAKSLDPNAHTFIPQISSSPEKQIKTRNSDQDWDKGTPSTPTTHNDSYAVQDPFQDQSRGQQSWRNIQLPSIQLQGRGAPESLVASLPPRWYGICPYSLASAKPCPLGVNCEFVPLCPNYNNENGDGCALFNRGGPTACRYAHEYRICEQAFSKKPGGCVWECNRLGNHPAAMNSAKKKKEIHMTIRAHKSTCSVADWEARMLLLSMREAHGKGLFNGK
ncbi:hypothetical protein ONS95_005233 [Cadophora gregata]|uniref:uncharacterized protein n=1 Tax=Cadophora gregata TaxID=51156 RepID=UPI0026DCFE4D|nr:uncharacterized protein ONS95_005233 [Cadophora gregata]KAK0104972.1 hypothetical protein ONS95_005233 [Cadophora gregata]KAK0114945.1 hypothetical protein ONS96_013420 [Cadophora gregata f. sp. sojae]